MSVVTDIIFAFGFPGPSITVEKIIQTVSDVLYESDYVLHLECRLKLINADCGGNKYHQVNIATGAFNYLPIPEAIERLKNLPWEAWELSFAQLMIQHEDNDGFVIIELHRDQWSDPPGYYGKQA